MERPGRTALGAALLAGALLALCSCGSSGSSAFADAGVGPGGDVAAGDGGASGFDGEAPGADAGGGGADGVTFEDGAVTFDPPAGAVPYGVVITVTPAEDYPEHDLLVPGTTWDFGPDGLSFAEPVDVLVRFDPARIPQGYIPESLRLHKVVDGAWQPVAGSGVYVDTSQVIAPLDGFSTYGVIAVSGTGQCRPVITEFQPTSGAPGDTVFIRGQCFKQNTPTTVSFGHPGNDAVLFDWGDSNINAIVPDGIPATTTPRTVQVYVTCGPEQSASQRYTLVLEPDQAPIELLAVEPDVFRVGETIRVTVRNPAPWPTGHTVVFDTANGEPNATPTEIETVAGSDDTVRLVTTVPYALDASGVLRVNRDTDNSVSNELAFTFLPPEAPVLAPNPDAEPLFDPWVVWDEGYPTESRGAWPHSLVLRGAGFLSFRSPIDLTTTAEGAIGSADVWVTTPLGQARLMGFALSDTLLAVPHGASAEFYGGRDEPTTLPPLLRGLEPGDPVTVRVCGVPVSGGPEVCSAEEALSVAEPPVRGAVHRIGAALYDEAMGLEEVSVPLGELLCIIGAAYAEPPYDQLSAPDLWEGTLSFGSYQTGWWDHLLDARCLRMDTVGDFVITNETLGRALTVHVDRAGIYAPAPFGELPGGGGGDPQYVAQTGLEMSAGGALLTIPPGALPLHDGSGAYDIVWEHTHSANTSPLDTQQVDADHAFRLHFDPEPDELLLPITLDLPYDPADHREPPEFALFDASSIYWTLDAERDEANGRIRFELPAGRYGAPSATKAANLPFTDVMVNARLNRVCSSLSLVSTRWDGAILEDTWGRVSVDYVTAAGSPHTVTDAHADQVLQTVVAAYDILAAYGWPPPPHRLAVYIRDIGDPGTYLGATYNNPLWGQPYVRINTRMTPGDNKFFSSVAHEIGHVFQRVRTTTFRTQWIDEATAEWVAHTTVGDSFWTYSMNNSIPWLDTLPGDFDDGMDEEEGYAAGSLAIWLALEYGVDVIDDLYTLLVANWSYWEDSYGAFANITGESIGEVYEKFAQAFWKQEYHPVDAVPLDPVLRNRLLTDFERDWTDFTGVEVREGVDRPALSSARYKVTPSLSFVSDAMDRPVVARLVAGGDATVVYVYGDPTCYGDDPVVGLEQLARLTSQTTSRAIGTVGDHACYRIVPINFTMTESERVSVRLVVPHITSLSPTHGGQQGGYFVTISGHGFGARGAARLGGFDLPILSWTDSSIMVRMIDVGTTQGSMDVVVETTEGAQTNAAPFSFP